MKIYFVFAVSVLFFLTSCNDAKFNRYPGTKLDSIPVDFRGIYKDPDSKQKQENSIIVETNYWMESSKPVKYYLSDSMVFSEYKGLYFMSSTDGPNQYWHVINVRKSGKDLVLYPILFDEKKPYEKNLITKYFTPQLDADSNMVFTMNEEKLWEYSNKELLKEDPMKLKRKTVK